MDKEKNIIFIGEGEAPEAIYGVEVFDDLPNPEDQANGFYYEQAAALIRAFPSLYKRMAKKGE